MPETSSTPQVRVLEFERQTAELAADQAWPIEEGWVVRTPSLPEVWFLNHLRVRVPISYEQALALCERHPVGATFDQLYVDEQAGGEALASRFRSEGWEVDVDVLSVLSAPPDREVDTTAVLEPRPTESLALMERWIREDKTLTLSEEGVQQMVEAWRRTWRVRNAVRLGVRGSGGELLGTTLLYSDATIAQVENVYVAPEARGRGYARAMVTHAAALAHQGGHELTFIVADDNDWPKQLYAKVGFAPVARSWLFHRDLKDPR